MVFPSRFNLLKPPLLLLQTHLALTVMWIPAIGLKFPSWLEWAKPHLHTTAMSRKVHAHKKKKRHSLVLKSAECLQTLKCLIFVWFTLGLLHTEVKVVGGNLSPHVISLAMPLSASTYTKALQSVRCDLKAVLDLPILPQILSDQTALLLSSGSP